MYIGISISLLVLCEQPEQNSEEIWQLFADWPGSEPQFLVPFVLQNIFDIDYPMCIFATLYIYIFIYTLFCLFIDYKRIYYIVIHMFKFNHIYIYIYLPTAAYWSYGWLWVWKCMNVAMKLHGACWGPNLVDQPSIAMAAGTVFGPELEAVPQPNCERMGDVQFWNHRGNSWG